MELGSRSVGEQGGLDLLHAALHLQTLRVAGRGKPILLALEVEVAVLFVVLGQLLVSIFIWGVFKVLKALHQRRQILALLPALSSVLKQRV